MARGLSQDGARTLAHRYFPSFLRQREEVEKLDKWHRGEQDNDLYTPTGSNSEYLGLQKSAPNSWASLIVTAVVQNAELTGIRMPGKDTDLMGWRSWQRNRMDAKQPRLYRGSCAHGLAFVKATKAKDPITGEPMSRWRLVSAQNMAIFFGDDDEWAMFGIEAQPLTGPLGGEGLGGWVVTLTDEVNDYTLICKTPGGMGKQDWDYVSHTPHGAPVVPIVQYAPNIDIDGRANSDLQGLLPLLSRIDQNTFDRLIVQRFGAWKVRYIAGMTPPKTPEGEAAKKLQLAVDKILIAGDKDTKFGTLDSTSLDGYISSNDSDLRELSALSQTPPHHLLGLSSNLQAESLAAAEKGLQSKSREHRLSWGESHEQLFRLDAYMRGDMTEAMAYEMESRWRDTESRSLEQAAMALGMLATNLKVPVELLWERIPNWTAFDVKRAKELVGNNGLDALIEQAIGTLQQQNDGTPAPGQGGSGGASLGNR